MFSVSDVDGSILRGTLEELLKIERALPVQRNRGVAQQHDGPAGTAAPSEQDAQRYHAAAAAYAQSLAPARDRGPVYHAYQLMSQDVC